jgi:hypothetical protein
VNEHGNGSSQPSIRGIELRAVVPELYSYLYDLFVGQHEVGIRWRYRGATPSPDDFARNLHYGVYAHYVGVRVNTDQIVSYVSAYRADSRDGHCYIAAAVPEELRLRTGAGIVSLGLLIDSLFINAPFRKLYAEAAEFNLHQYASAIPKFFEIEGRLTEHEWFEGRFRDVYILSLTRDRWMGLRSRYGFRPNSLTPDGGADHHGHRANNSAATMDHVHATHAERG